MIFRLSSLFASLALLSAFASLAAEGSRLVVVLEFRNKLRGAELEAVDAGYLADLVRSAVLESVHDVQVMTRENVQVLLQSQGKRLEDCEGQCEVDTGRLLGADFIISGEVLKFGSSFKVNLKLHDTKSGRLLAGQQVSGAHIDELDRNTSPAVRKLVEPLAKAAPKQQVARPDAGPIAPREERQVDPPKRAETPPIRTEPRVEPPRAEPTATRTLEPEEKHKPFTSELGVYVAHLSDPNPCRRITVTSCNATNSGLGAEILARGSFHVAGPLRVGLAGGLRYLNMSLDSSLTLLPSAETTDWYLVAQLPVDVTWRDFSIGWTPYLQLQLTDENKDEPAFKWNRFEASYGGGIKISLIVEPPVGERHFLIGGGLSFEL